MTYASQQDWDDSNLSKGPGDPDTAGYYPRQKPPSVRYVGEDAAMVRIERDKTHWSDLPKPVVTEVPDWDFGDRMPDGSDDQGYDLEEDLIRED